MEEVVASAPGKVLITGGYLILERPNAGVVLSTNARFYATVKPIYDQVKPETWAWSWTDIKVTSPQLCRESTYKLSLKNLKLQPASLSEPRNPFVEHAVEYSVAAAHAIFEQNKKKALSVKLLQGIHITILGCNDFYSYRNQIEASGLPLTPETLAALPPFSSITFNADVSNEKNSKPEVAKTGLGSSAAMTTAAVAALLHYLGVVSLPKAQQQKNVDLLDLDTVHVIAQSAHCIAQGKVGSGFDVSSAVYGSQRYVRFSPDVLSSTQATANALPLEEVIGNALRGKWDHERTKFSLPPLMNLLLGEPGTGGSSTPSMVGAVKKWQKLEPEKSKSSWRNLSEANSELERQLNILSSFAERDWGVYRNVIDQCSSLKSEKWIDQAMEPSKEAVVKSLLGARDAMIVIRNLMRQMGEAAGVPIEPESQTQLLDATMNVEGVLLAGVPGAGGFDAIFAVTLGDSSNKVTREWSTLGVLAMLVREDPVGVCLEDGDPRSQELTTAVSAVSIS